MRRSLRIGTHGQRLGISILAVLVFAVLAIGSGAKPASAYGNTLWVLRNYQTGLCLASNSSGQVYTEGCSGGSSEEWQVAPTPSSSPNLAIQSTQTGLWLDSNSSGSLYTLPGNGGRNQAWYLFSPDGASYSFQDVATGLWLDSNYSGAAYTSPGNGGLYQRWLQQR